MISRFALILSLCLLMFLSAIGLGWKPFRADPLTISDFNQVSASCKPTGSITIKSNIRVSDYSFSWTKPNGEFLSASPSISALVAGTYTLTYTSVGTAAATLTFQVLSAQPNAATQEDLVIACDETRIRVHADGFPGVAPSTYKWESTTGVLPQTGEFVDLTAGQYYVTIIDANGCSSNRASIFVKAASSRPVIDENNKVLSASSCSIDDGSITGIRVGTSNGGPYSYTWRNATGDIVGTDLDLVGVPAGKYRLATRESSGICERLSSEFLLENRNPITVNTNRVITKAADCQQPIGSVTGVETNANIFRWINAAKETVSNQKDLVNVKEGFYELILSNGFGCESVVGPFHVQAGNPPIVLQSQLIVKDDNCNLSIGSITGASVIGSGIRYSWADASGKVISTDPNLTKVKAGDYFLTVRNPSCSQTFTYTVHNSESQFPQPVLADKFICSATDVLISFNETAPLYRIYDENGTLLQESKKKAFMLSIRENRRYYGALANGTCESARTAFDITVGEAALKIPSSFTPNNDGINDKWILKGIEVYQTADVKIFNRYGSLVYRNTNTSLSFDGKKDGNDLPSGVYYYIIKLTNECNPFSGSLTILR